MNPFEAPGVSIDVDGLLALRHLAQDGGASTSATTMPGGFVSRRRGRGLETADIRVFEEGDDIRHIDRNATARTGTPHVRTFQDERDRTALLLADFRTPMLWGTRRAFRSVAAAEALTLAGWRAMREGGRVGLIAFGGAEPVLIPARGRERGMISVVGGMAEAHRAALNGATAEPLAKMLTMAEKVAPRGASVCLASSLDDPGEGLELAATSLAHRADLTILRIRDAFERTPPAGAYPFETALGRRGIGVVGEGGATEAEMTTRLMALGVSVIEIDAAEPPTAMTGAMTGANYVG